VVTATRHVSDVLRQKEVGGFMNKPRFLVLGSIVLILSLVTPIIGGCGPSQDSRLKVVTSTSLLTYIVQEVAGVAVDVFNVVPAAQHPGDFDARPGDVQRLAAASLFLVHGFPGETYVPGMVAAANNPGLKVVTISVDGSWMTPAAQLAATDKVVATLIEAAPKDKDTFEKRAARYKDRVRAKETELRSRMAKADLTSLKAIASGFQAPFAAWAGIKVNGTYLTPESLTPQAVKDLVDKGRTAGVNVIIDNVHSGRDAGKCMAEELEARRIVLVYFPGGLDNTETWEKAIDYNVDQILKAAAR
jgi:zinc transport system substrate-binding protein